MTGWQREPTQPGAGEQPIEAGQTKKLGGLLILAVYGVFLWRTPYSLKLFPLSILDWLVPAAGIGIWIVMSLRRRASWPSTTLDLPLLAWIAAALLSAVFSANVRISLPAAWETFISVLILWLMVAAVRQGWERALWQTTYLVGGVVCVLAATELVAWYLGLPLVSSFQQGWPEIGGLADPLPPVLYRMRLTLSHPTVLSAFLALLVPPAVSIAVSTEKRDTRVGMALWLTGAAAVLFFTFSRSGLLALGISLPLLFAGSTRSPQLRGWWSALSQSKRRAILTLFVVLVLVVVSGAGYFLISSRGERASGDAVRADLWRSAGEMLLDQPVTGVGSGAFGYALRAYRDPYLAREGIGSAHNLYLNMGAETGLPGVLIGGWLILGLAWAWWRGWKGHPAGSASWWRLLGSGAALAGLAAQMMVEAYSEPAVLLPASFFVACVLAPGPGRPRTGSPDRRWPWVAALVVLVLGTAGMAWDTWVYAQFRQSVTSLQRGDWDEAVAAAERALARDPGLPLYSCHTAYLYGLEAAVGRDEALVKALARYDECLGEIPVPGWLDQLNLAAVQWQAGDEKGARRTAEEATAHTPREWIPWLNRGLWAEKTGAHDEARVSYGRVLSLNPALAGSPFWRQGDRAAWWDDILAVREGSRGAGAWRSKVQLAAGRFEEAAAELEAWLEAHPGDVETMVLLGEALVGLNQPAEALAWLDQAVTAESQRAQSYLVRGEARLALGLFDEAERDLRMALFLEPEARVHLGLARLGLARADAASAQHEYAQALRSFSVLQLYPPVLYGRMGWSVPLPQVARIGTRYDGEAALEWGALAKSEGDISLAREIYTTALTLDPFLDRVQERLNRLEGP